MTREEMPFVKKFFDHLLDKGWFLLFYCDDIRDAQNQKIYLQNMGYDWHDPKDVFIIPTAIILSPRERKLFPYHPRRTPDKTLYFNNARLALSDLKAALVEEKKNGKDVSIESDALKKIFNDILQDYIKRGMPTKNHLKRKKATFKNKNPKPK